MTLGPSQSIALKEVVSAGLYYIYPTIRSKRWECIPSWGWNVDGHGARECPSSSSFPRTHTPPRLTLTNSHWLNIIWYHWRASGGRLMIETFLLPVTTRGSIWLTLLLGTWSGAGLMSMRSGRLCPWSLSSLSRSSVAAVTTSTFFDSPAWPVSVTTLTPGCWMCGGSGANTRGMYDPPYWIWSRR